MNSIKSKYTTIYLIILICFAIAISKIAFVPRSLRLDEAQSLWQTGRSLIGMYQILLTDVHVPFYHTLLHFWILFLGNTVTTARTLSLIFFVLAIPIVYALAKLTTNAKAALFATTLFVLSPFMSWYGSEIRMYSLLVLVTVISQLMFVEIIKRPRPIVWLGYALATIIGVYTHYFFLFNILTQVVFYFAYRKKFSRGSFIRFVLVAIVTGLVFSPWVISFIHAGYARNSQPLLLPPTGTELLGSYFKYIFGFYNDGVNALVVSLWPILAILIFLAILRKSVKPPIAMQYIFYAAILPSLMVFLISITITPLYLPRYLIIVLPAFCIAIAWYINNYPKPVSTILYLLVLLAVFVSLVFQISTLNIPVEEEYKSAVDYLQKKVDIQDAVIVSAPFTIYPIEYYFNKPIAIATLPIWDRYTQGIPPFQESELPAQVAKITDSHKSVWLLLSYDQGYEHNIREYFGNHYELIEQKNFSPGLNLYHYKLYNF